MTGAPPTGASPAPPGLDYAFSVRVRVGAPLELGETATGRRRVIPILGGEVDGPRLAGEVVPGGADWQSLRADGTADLVARYTLRATDGTLIGVVNRGLRRGPPEVLARLASGAPVSPDLYYFRATPRFEAPPGPHGWLADHVFVATGERRAAMVLLAFFLLR